MIFASLMFLLIYQFSAEGMYTAMAFLIGGIVSMLCGAIGMLIATRTNFRTAFCAQISLSKAFRTAYRGGCAIGFALVSLGLLGNNIFLIF
jgi:K(+)-stimulated pyrophosphate-energized sodium pump